MAVVPPSEEEILNNRNDLKKFIRNNSEKGSLQALTIALNHGGTDGAHHKDWVIDQMCRALTGKNYQDFVTHACDGEYGPETYSWEEGMAP